MKKLMIFLLIVGFVGVAGGTGFDIQFGKDGDIEVMLPEHSEHMDPGALFDEFGCLIAGAAGITDSDMPCLDLNNDGCVTREAWDAYMGYWSVNTPEPEIPLCEQMLNR